MRSKRANTCEFQHPEVGAPPEEMARMEVADVGKGQVKEVSMIKLGD